jgi:hypothetical protein
MKEKHFCLSLDCLDLLLLSLTGATGLAGVPADGLAGGLAADDEISIYAGLGMNV